MHASSYFMPFKEPKVIKADSSYKELVKILKENKIERLLLVSDKNIQKLSLFDNLADEFGRNNIKVSLFLDIRANPTIDNVENGLKLYLNSNSQAIIAVGGGSVMDAAKLIGARSKRRNKSLNKMKGLFGVLRKLPLLIAIPTTSGTGSEVTLAAVVVDEEREHKFAIMDFSLIPKYAVFDVKMTKDLPAFVTATTGLDALVHSIEAYIGSSRTKKTKEYSIRAVNLIFNNLEKVYKNAGDLEARANMQKAAYLAGLAFTRSYVGNIHALSHTISAHYSLAHGLVNAILMPKVLHFYDKSASKKLSNLAIKANIVSKDTKDADKVFIKMIEDLNKTLNIPLYLDEIREEDYPILAKDALKEANPLYPVPKIFEKKDFFTILDNCRRKN